MKSKAAGNPYLAFGPPSPTDDIPELKECSVTAPCQHYEGDCQAVGDEGCAGSLGKVSKRIRPELPIVGKDWILKDTDKPWSASSRVAFATKM